MEEGDQRLTELKNVIERLGYHHHVVPNTKHRKDSIVIDHPGRFACKDFATLGYRVSLLEGTQFAVSAVRNGE